MRQWTNASRNAVAQNSRDEWHFARAMCACMWRRTHSLASSTQFRTKTTHITRTHSKIHSARNGVGFVLSMVKWAQNRISTQHSNGMAQNVHVSLTSTVERVASTAFAFVLNCGRTIFGERAIVDCCDNKNCKHNWYQMDGRRGLNEHFDGWDSTKSNGSDCGCFKFCFFFFRCCRRRCHHQRVFVCACVCQQIEQILRFAFDRFGLCNFLWQNLRPIHWIAEHFSFFFCQRQSPKNRKQWNRSTAHERHLKHQWSETTSVYVDLIRIFTVAPWMSIFTFTFRVTTRTHCETISNYFSSESENWHVPRTRILAVGGSAPWSDSQCVSVHAQCAINSRTGKCSERVNVEIGKCATAKKLKFKWE